MASYDYDKFTNTTQVANQFKRSSSFPVDLSSIFDSYEDASKYAKGSRTSRDERNLYASSYVGQILTVYENGDISQYKIMEDRTLAPLVPIEKFTRNGQPLSAVDKIIDIEVPEYTSGEGIEIGVDNEINITTINCGEF